MVIQLFLLPHKKNFVIAYLKFNVQIYYAFYLYFSFIFNLYFNITEITEYYVLVLEMVFYQQYSLLDTIILLKPMDRSDNFINFFI